jgi:uncharacterized RDD family membrane protein YckC/predicted RNA-binding Zn-ribbon protein involved in translation (DUF1610 family)
MLVAPNPGFSAMDNTDPDSELVRTNCTNCNKRLKVARQHLSRVLNCPRCGHVVTISEQNPNLPLNVTGSTPVVTASTSTVVSSPQPIVENDLEYLIHYQPAGPGIRFAAFCIDVMAFTVIYYATIIAMCVILLIFVKMFSSFSPLVSLDAYSSVSGFFQAFLETVINCLLSGRGGLIVEAWFLSLMYISGMCFMFYLLWITSCRFLTSEWQATLGKKLLGLIVVDESGKRLTNWQATTRWFYRAVGCCGFCLGFIGINHEPYQTWYDRMSKTQVLRRRTYDLSHYDEQTRDLSQN